MPRSLRPSDVDCTEDRFAVFVDRLGKVYDQTGARHVTGLTDAELAELREQRRILVAQTQDGSYVYPVRQFRHGAVDERILGALQSLTAFSPLDWSVLGWFTAIRDDLGGLSALDCLLTGHRTGQVERLAQEDATRWRD